MIPLTKTLAAKIKDRWLTLWHESRTTDAGEKLVELWFRAVTDTLETQGFHILSAELLAEESTISVSGNEKLYVDALIEVTKATPENVMALVTATPQQRLKAVRMVHAAQERKSISKQSKGSH